MGALPLRASLACVFVCIYVQHATECVFACVVTAADCGVCVYVRLHLRAAFFFLLADLNIFLRLWASERVVTVFFFFFLEHLNPVCVCVRLRGQGFAAAVFIS